MENVGESGCDPPDPPSLGQGQDRPSAGNKDSRTRQDPSEPCHQEKMGESQASSSVFNKSNKTMRSPSSSHGNKAPSTIAFRKLFNGVLTRSQSVTDLMESEMGDTPPTNEKRTRSPGENELGAKRVRTGIVTSPMDAAMNKIKELIALSNEHTTTPRRIKSGIIDMGNLLEDLLKEWTRTNEQLKNSNTENTQDTGAKIRARIGKIMTKDEVLNLANEEWPNSAYYTTTLSSKNIDGKVGLKSTLVFVDSFETQSSYKKLVAIVPELNGVTPDLLRKVGTIEVNKKESTSITGLDAAEVENLYQVHPALISSETEIEYADINSWAQAIKRASENVVSKNVEVFLPDKIDVMRVRKILECALSNTGIRILVRIPRQLRRSHQEHQRPQSNSIIVHMKGSATYSQVVKDLKESIDPDEVGVQINRVNRTTNGQIKIQLKENCPGAKKRMLDIIQNIKSADKVTEVHKTKGIVIMHIENDTDIEEIRKSITTELGVEPDQIRTNPTRQMKHGTKMISVFLPVQAANEAIRRAKLKIGWTRCTVKERVEAPWCRNCKRIGHHQRDCKEETVNVLCLRCGGEHETRVCTSENEFCITCRVDGHRANGFKCPIYRTFINGSHK